MGKITLNKERCKGCLLCIAVCPKGLLAQSEGLNRKGVKPAEFKGASPGECLGCGMCAVICPDCCIEVYR